METHRGPNPSPLIRPRPVILAALPEHHPIRDSLTKQLSVDLTLIPLRLSEPSVL